mmetsp:Transcript_102054/g.288190  ORF Transcript_102054/g.288190 Transcript_102054/m.288190 type:complete len:98 (-) Transcript_102054:1288-1581(-)
MVKHSLPRTGAKVARLVIATWIRKSRTAQFHSSMFPIKLMLPLPRLLANLHASARVPLHGNTNVTTTDNVNAAQGRLRGKAVRVAAPVQEQLEISCL